ncbi:MAG: P-loop NTPase [Lachnospiraceae bacterium]
MSEEVKNQETEECSHDCSSCSANCGSRTAPEDMMAKLNPRAKVKKVIGVVSGKGGVGKSFVTSYLAVLFQKMGKRAAVLDADLTGPSIPKAFGVTGLAEADEEAIFPMKTMTGIQMISINNLLEAEDTPVLWRGPVIAGTVKQFWSDVLWDDVDYMFVDMPPGTGDVPLTVFQSLPVDGIIVVTSPQSLVSMIVGKAVNMAKAMNVPIIGIVENYSYLECPDCGKHIAIYGDSHIEQVAEKYGIEVLAKVPLDPSVAETVDSGAIETLKRDWLDGAVRKILDLTNL